MVNIKVTEMVTKQSQSSCLSDLEFSYQWFWPIVHSVLKTERDETKVLI